MYSRFVFVFLLCTVFLCIKNEVCKAIAVISRGNLLLASVSSIFDFFLSLLFKRK